MDAEQKKNMRILIVEDDVMLSRIYQTKFTALGYATIMARDGEEGLEKMDLEPPHIVLLDLMLPKKNGFQVLEEMKKNEKTKDIPVIILSNLGQGSDIARARELGAEDFLIKNNVRLEAVIQRTEDILQQRYG